jgi:hypothetical protein
MDRFGFSVALAIREEGRGWHRLEAERPNRPRPASRERQFGTPTQANLKLTTSRWLPEMARGATKAAQRERKRVRQNSKRQLRPWLATLISFPFKNSAASGGSPRTRTSPSSLDPLTPRCHRLRSPSTHAGAAGTSPSPFTKRPGCRSSSISGTASRFTANVVDGNSSLDVFGRRNWPIRGQAAMECGESQRRSSGTTSAPRSTARNGKRRRNVPPGSSSRRPLASYVKASCLLLLTIAVLGVR